MEKAGSGSFSPKIPSKSKKTLPKKPRSEADRRTRAKMSLLERALLERALLKQGVVNFFSSKDAFRCLSNFWECEVVVDGRIYESGEHAFHGEKYTRLGALAEPTRQSALLDYGGAFRRPSPYKTGAIAKRMGGKRGMMLSGVELGQWESLSMRVQLEICEWKLQHHAMVRADLLSSRGKILIHPALRCSEAKLGSRIWEGRGVVQDGRIVVLGRNELGRMWMQLRDDV
jgi:predicted NAD-dependent protein-ADP-ribosyltransferase YbiA (DUF1768 family)